MDIYLDTLIHLPYITVDGCREVDGTVFLKLKCLNDTIDCPECGARLDRINQTEEILVRDLPVFGKPVYLQGAMSRRFTSRCSNQVWKRSVAEKE